MMTLVDDLRDLRQHLHWLRTDHYHCAGMVSGGLVGASLIAFVGCLRGFDGLCPLQVYPKPCLDLASPR